MFPYLAKSDSFLRRFDVAGKKINLCNLENKILRKRFNDPRIHFVINCTSKSCPNLPNRLFIADTLDNYLDSLTINFINDTDHVYIDSEKDVQFSNGMRKILKIGVE